MSNLIILEQYSYKNYIKRKLLEVSTNKIIYLIGNISDMSFILNNYKIDETNPNNLIQIT